MNSERLTFTKYTSADFDDYYKLVSNAEVMKMITGRPHTEAETRERLIKMTAVNNETPNIGHFKVSLTASDTFVGHAKLVMTKNEEAEIGYVLLPDHWRKGFGEEIAQFLIDLAKKTDAIKNLIAITDPENAGSKRILEKQGFLWDYNGDYLGLPATYYKMVL